MSVTGELIEQAEFLEDSLAALPAREDVEQADNEVRLHPEAIRTYRRLRGSPIAGAAKLAGRDDFRIRLGDYRIVYAVDDQKRLVIIARIAHRRDADWPASG